MSLPYPRDTLRSSSGHFVRSCSVLASVLLTSACGPNTECSDYRPASVAEMRTAFWSGCFELREVVVVARAPSSTTPRLYVQDAAGGDFSAIVVKCDDTSGHPCPASTGVAVSSLLDGAAVNVRGYYHRGMQSGFEELQLDELNDEGTLLQPPAAITLAPADLERAGRSVSKWFQRATVDISKDDPLVMYDMSPAEFQLSGSCPGWSGFGMIALSAGTAPPLDCNAARNPASVEDPDPREVLIGRQFFDLFSYSTDCACYASSKQHLLSPQTFVDGTLTGILTLGVESSSVRSYQVFEPLSKAFFPVQ